MSEIRIVNNTKHGDDVILRRVSLFMNGAPVTAQTAFVDGSGITIEQNGNVITVEDKK